MNNKKRLATKRRNDFIDVLARVMNFQSSQISELDKYIQEQLTTQEQLDLFKPSNVRLIESILESPNKYLNLPFKNSRACNFNRITLDKILERVKDKGLLKC